MHFCRIFGSVDLRSFSSRPVPRIFILAPLRWKKLRPAHPWYFVLKSSLPPDYLPRVLSRCEYELNFEAVLLLSKSCIHVCCHKNHNMVALRPKFWRYCSVRTSRKLCQPVYKKIHNELETFLRFFCKRICSTTWCLGTVTTISRLNPPANGQAVIISLSS